MPIAESGSVSVFDGTEPGRPMWGRWAFAPATFGAITGLAAINGKVLVATTLGLITLDLAKDEGRFQQAAADRTFRLTDRASGSQVLLARPAQAFIVNNAVNAVAACVLPDAPFDGATGLQVPTIAVGTAGGVSVIKHNGTVSTQAFSFTPSDYLAFQEGRLLFTDVFARFGLRAVKVSEIAAPTFTSAIFNVGAMAGSAFQSMKGSGANVFGRTDSSSAPFASIARICPSIPTASSFAKITDKFSTGFLAGDIRRAYLCNTEVESVGSGEILADGVFASAAGWVGSGCTVAVVGGELEITATVAGVVQADLAITGWVIGRRYLFSGYGYKKQATGGINLTVPSIFDGAISVSTTLSPVAGIVFTANSVSMPIRVRATSAVIGDKFAFDNLSARECVDDRSYKAAGAAIFGTLVKTPVAVGAQLVGYSGFSALNYIQEPPSTDLDFGTGEWQFGDWFSAPAVMPAFGTYPAIAHFDAGERFNTADWTKGAGWVATSGTVLTCDGTQTSNSDCINIGLTAVGTSEIRRWTVAVSAISGSLGVFANNTTPFSITAPGTYHFSSYGGTGNGTKIFRIAPGQTCTLTLSVDTVGPLVIAERSAATGPSIKLGMDAAGRLVATAYDGVTTRTVVTDAPYNTGAYMLGEACYKAGKLWIEVGGNEVKSVTGTPLLTMNNALAVLTIGQSRTLDAPWPGLLAPLKIGATVPTPEQSNWKHSQEKQMFREGAQITLPAATAVVDLHYDEQLDKWVITQATHKSSFTGLIRTAVATPSAGSFSRVAASGGVELTARTTASPGVDVFVPAYGLREELVRRAEAAAKASKTLTVFDFDAIAAQTEFALPVGWAATEVLSAGASQREGATKAWQRLYDGFRETIKFAVAPGAAVWVQITARKE